MFDDLIDANRQYAAEFKNAGVTGTAARGLAVVTCIDSRIEPLRMLGLVIGDAKIIRNAGARVTDDALRSLILATNLLGVNRICVVQHTDCAMAKSSSAEIATKITTAAGADASSVDFLAMDDQLGALRDDIARIRECAFIPTATEVGGFIYNVHTGVLEPAQL